MINDVDYQYFDNTSDFCPPIGMDGDRGAKRSPTHKRGIHSQNHKQHMKKLLLILAIAPALNAGDIKIINGEVYQKMESANQSPTPAQIAFDLRQWKQIVGNAPYTPPSQYGRAAFFRHHEQFAIRHAEVMRVDEALSFEIE